VRNKLIELTTGRIAKTINKTKNTDNMTVSEDIDRNQMTVYETTVHIFVINETLCTKGHKIFKAQESNSHRRHIYF